MVYIRIKHGEHEIEIRGEQDYVQGQLEQFYISIENHERLIRTMQGTDYHGEKKGCRLMTLRLVPQLSGNHPE